VGCSASSDPKRRHPVRGLRLEELDRTDNLVATARCQNSANSHPGFDLTGEVTLKKSGEIRFSRISLVLIGLAVIAVAFLGVTAGLWFVNWRQDQAYDQQVQAMRHGEGSLFQPGDFFPAVELVDLSGNSDNIAVLAHGQKTLMLLMSIGCDPCTEAIQTWKQDADKSPSDLQVLGICQGDFEYAQVYKKKTGFPFPLYCDTGHVFPAECGLDVFPSVVGLTADGRVAFLREGRHADITLLDAYDLITQADSIPQQKR